MKKQINLPQSAPPKKKDPLPVRLGRAVTFALVGFIFAVLALAIVGLCLIALNGVLEVIREQLAILF